MCVHSLLKRKAELKSMIESSENVINYLRDEIADIMLQEKSKMLGKEYELVR
jgi:hypothetical protein